MSTDLQTSSKQTNPDAAIMVGGPGGIVDGQAMPKDGEIHPEAKDKKVVEEKVKYELNGKTFASPEDMSKYVADLEQKVIAQPQFVTPQPQNNNTKQQILVDGMTLDTLMFANPERYTQYLQEQAEKKLDQKLQLQENKRQFWSDFYTNNPDLRGKEEIVDMLVAKNWASWEKMPIKDFAKVVSDTSRSTLSKIGASNAQEVANNPAATLGASGSSAPKIEQTRKETSLVDEMKQMSQKRRLARVK